MDYIGKKLRLQKFTNKDWNVLLAIDHGVSNGPIIGLESVDRIASIIETTCLQGVVLHRGMLKALLSRSARLNHLGIIVQLNAMSNMSNEADNKIMLTNVETAVRYGADAVSIQLNFNEENFNHNLTMLAATSQLAEDFGMPLMVMLYDKFKASSLESAVRYANLLRILVELGVDMVKFLPPEDISQLPQLLEGVYRDCHVFLAGGEKCTVNQLNSIKSLAKQAGASGFCMGRNIFQRSKSDEIYNLCNVNEGNYIYAL